LPERRSATAEPTLPKGYEVQSVRLFLERRDDEIYVLEEVHAKLISDTDYILSATLTAKGLCFIFLSCTLFAFRPSSFTRAQAMTKPEISFTA
jgi:hypothetical protein